MPDDPPPAAAPTSSKPRHLHIALVGMMGVGKSAVGKVVARRTGARLVDVDREIEGRCGRTTKQLWEEGGEAAYRPIELDVVRSALDSAAPIVLATPGGVVVDDDLAAEVDRPEVAIVHLRATAATLVERIGDGADHRPLLGDDPAATIERLARERAGRYEAIAETSIDVDDLTAGQVADRVVAWVRAGR